MTRDQKSSIYATLQPKLGLLPRTRSPPWMGSYWTVCVCAHINSCSNCMIKNWIRLPQFALCITFIYCKQSLLFAGEDFRNSTLLCPIIMPIIMPQYLPFEIRHISTELLHYLNSALILGSWQCRQRAGSTALEQEMME